MDVPRQSRNGRTGVVATDGGRRTFTLSSRATAPRDARLELSALPGVSGDVAYRVLLVASEIVTSCVEHALDLDEPIEIATDIDDLHIRVTIASTRRTPLHGHARRVVDRIADRWGATADDGNAMWFEVDRRRG